MKKLLTSVALMVAGVSSVHAQSDCTNAFDLGTDIALNTTSCGINTATMDNSITQFSGNQCGQTVVGEVWTMFTITDGSLPSYLFSAENTSNNQPFGLQVFSGSCGSLNLLLCINNEPQGAGGTPFETGSLANLANGTYYVRLISYNNLNWDSEICVTHVSGVTNNDDCANAIPVTVGSNGICTEVTGTNTGATASSGVPAPSCSNYSGGDVWFSITVPSSGTVTFASDYAASNSLTDIGMAIYSGTCGSLTEIDCDDDSGNGAMSSISASGLTPGSTIYVRVWEYGNDETGDFDLCFSEPPLPDPNQDCIGSMGLCTDATLSGASNGSGSVTDLDGTNEGCLVGSEHESNWYNLEISTAGVFSFTLSPNNGTDDYDFAVWVYPGGAGQGCPPSGLPDRCSFGGGSGLNNSYDTGLGQGAMDTSEDASGDNWVSTINVNVGDVIVMIIDNFSQTTSPFTLDFTGNAGLDCSVLPAELMTFYAEHTIRGNKLHWKTLSELQNDYFTIEYSMDGSNWNILTTVDGNETTSDVHAYSAEHLGVFETAVYYKLYQTDFDGQRGSEKIISIDASKVQRELLKTVNTMGQEVNGNYHGIVFDVYSDGTSKKRMQ